MPGSSDQRWERLIEEKRNSLSKVTLRTSVRTNNCEGFLAHFSSVVVNLALSDGSDIVDRFVASLDPLRSFTTAAIAASQDEEGLQSVWAVLLALVESASRSTKTFNIALGQIADFNQALSSLKSSIDPFSDRPQLPWIFRDLFDDYLGS